MALAHAPATVFGFEFGFGNRVKPVSLSGIVRIVFRYVFLKFTTAIKSDAKLLAGLIKFVFLQLAASRRAVIT